jgi:hypothetical protein
VAAGLQNKRSRGSASGDIVLAARGGTTGAQALCGVAAIVLGILAVAGTATQVLSLVGLLVLGAALLATGNGVNNAVSAALRSRRSQI